MKVYTDALEEGLSLWMGFACWGGSWAEHCWCMLGNRIVETTGPFRVYYGAELTSEERELLRERCGNFDLTAREHLHVITSDEWGRKHVKYDPAVYSKSIGRERDPKTGAIKPGLGH